MFIDCKNFAGLWGGNFIGNCSCDNIAVSDLNKILVFLGDIKI